MRPTFEDIMKQLAMKKVDKDFYRIPDLRLGDHNFGIMVLRGDKTIKVCVDAHKPENYKLVRPLETKTLDNDENAGLAVFYFLATFFLGKHLFKEFNNWVMIEVPA